MSGKLSKIGFLGTGRMGAPMARNLARRGFPVVAWNRSVERVEALAAEGVEAASTPAAAAGGADVLITMLVDGPAIEQTMLGDDGALAAIPSGAVWIQMATVGLEWNERLAALAAAQRIAFVDAPVSGSDVPAEEAKLVILASGDEAIRTRVQPIFDALGRRTVWVGRAGGGTALKLVLNAWLAAVAEAAAEGVALSEALGLDPRVFTETLADVPIGSPYGVAKANAMIDSRFEPGFALRNAYKDVGLALAGAASRDLDLPLLDVIDARWRQAIAEGHGEEDVAAVIASLRRGGVTQRAAPV